MTVTASPRGTFFIARHGDLVVFDRDRALAIARLARLIWKTRQHKQPETTHA